MNLLSQGTHPHISPGQLIVAGGILALIPSSIIYILLAAGYFPSPLANLMLFATVPLELILLATCAILEDRHQIVTKFVQIKVVAFLLGWTGYKSR